MQRFNLIAAALMMGLGVLLLGLMVYCTVSYVYVDEGYSLRLRYKGPLVFGSGTPAKAGHFAQEGEVGVLENLRGPGRHFYCPVWWERKIIQDEVVMPGQVAVVTSKLGDPLPTGQFLVDGGISGPDRAKNQGILRKVFGPGRYRVNTYGFEFKIVKQSTVSSTGKHAGWVNIPTGFVGVVTYMADNTALQKKAGIQAQVLPPGIYPVNEWEQQIDLVEIGFWETSMSVAKVLDRAGKEVLDPSGEPEAIADSGIGFPSSDGYKIQLDFTAIWGVMPKDAPDVVQTFGTVKAAEQKVIIPQSESISRINGSKLTAKELLVGETRQIFQSAVSSDFQEVLKDKHLSLLYSLVRHIYIPKNIREPLQKGYVADELKLTRDEERTTKQAEGELREAEKRVFQEAEKVKVETAKLVAEAIAAGQKQVGEIGAATQQQVAAIEKQIAELDAKKIEQLGKAKAQSDQLMKEATSQRFDMAVKAFGNSDAYTKWQFAEGLPENIQLQLFYAGQGTLWTDLKSVTPTLPVANPPATPTQPTRQAAPSGR
jgi:hypothetical protein